MNNTQREQLKEDYKNLVSKIAKVAFIRPYNIDDASINRDIAIKALKKYLADFERVTQAEERRKFYNMIMKTGAGYSTCCLSALTYLQKLLINQDNE